MGKVHKLGSSVDSPWVKFPDNFCLEELINDTCGAPAGISAIVYDTNPMVKLFLQLLLEKKPLYTFFYYRVVYHPVQDFQ